MSLDLTELSDWNIFDADDTGADGTLRIQVSEGVIDCTVGNSGVVIASGDNSSNLLLTGTNAELNALLKNQTTGTLVYTTAVPGVKTFTVTNTDSDGLAGVITFTAEALAFANPVITPPGITTQVDVGVAFDLAGIGFSVADPDETGLIGSMTLSITNGAITVTPGNSGVQVISGNGTASVVLAGTVPSFSILLDSTSSGVISYAATTAGSKTFTVLVTDNGGLSDTDTATVVAGDAPVVVSPSLVTTPAGDNKNLEGLGFSVTDADDAGGTATAVLQTTLGTIDVTVGNSGVTIFSGDMTATVTLTGTITQLKNLLDDTSTGTIILSPGVSVTDGTITLTVTDSTSRFDSAVAVLSVTEATPTWTGYVSCTPQAALATLTDFYAPIDLSRFPAEWWAIVSTDGRDIRCTLSNNTLLPRDLIHFDKVAKTGLLTVKFNHSTTPPLIRVHAGAPSATALGDTDTYGRENTYASYVRGYWPDGGGTDRTGYDNDLSSTTTTVGDTLGPFGLATTYNGSSSQASTGVSLPTGLPCNLGCFINPNVVNSYHAGIALGGTTVSGPVSSQQVSWIAARVGVGKAETVSGYEIAAYNNGFVDIAAVANYNIAQAPGSLVSGGWTSLAGIFTSASVCTAFRDTSFASHTLSAGTTINTPLLSLGALVYRNGPGGVNFYNGRICQAYLWTNASAANYVLNFALTRTQATYWPTWAFSTETLTGL